eukprot:2212299-Prymnesium_polylepis.1
MACHGLRRRCVPCACATAGWCWQLSNEHVPCRFVGSCMTPQPCPAGSSSSLGAEANTAACEAVSGGV